ncbi:MAG TPA: thioesterase family protein [Flavobacteriaceae bacterium]|nr:thioesterase family protein [Flavobacteriaceae bacterium]
MKKNLTKIRVRYGETDQMGVVYYGNYALYIEQGRTEWLRDLGISYKWMEDQNIMLPVVHLSIDYKASAFYDDLLTIETTLEEIPNVKIIFNYKIFNEQNKLLATAKTILVFIEKDSGKIRRAPDFLLERINRD